MWKKIIYNGIVTNYSVSDTGEVKNDTTEQILGQWMSKDGYKYTTISLGHQQSKHVRIHRLVATAFIENPYNKPFVNHLDGDPTNNNLTNLEWCTPSENSLHAVRAGLKYVSHTREVVQYDLDGNKMMEYESAHEAATELGLNASKITLCCQKKRITTGLYQWRYKDDPDPDVHKVNSPKTIKKKVAKCDEDMNVLEIYESFRDAARAVDGTSSAISRICSGSVQCIRHKGYRWKLVDEIVQADI